MSAYDRLQVRLRSATHTWLITGVAGFIGSNLLEKLLKLDQQVVGLDNFSTGHRRNLTEVKALVTSAQWKRFRFFKGDICDMATCRRACKGADFVLHQAALASVPRSLTEPLKAHHANVTGFVVMLIAAQKAKVRRFVYASSSAVYGNDPTLPKVETNIGQPLSPYAVTKLVNEDYANAFTLAYKVEAMGLRYFNVFGPRQDPEGAYAAVIPKWTASLLRQEEVHINGDGKTSRDFCFVDNVVQANLLAATTNNTSALNQIYNIGFGRRTALNELFELLKKTLRRNRVSLPATKAKYRNFRPGDVRHSLADISKAQSLLGFQPTHNVEQGLEVAMGWYLHHLV